MTGHPTPVVKWSKSFGQLPQERVQSNNSVIKLLSVRKGDSDNYLCTATNLLGSVVKRTVLVVVPMPRFIVKPPTKLVASFRQRITLNCSAIGDPQPVISWRKQGSKLPVGRSQQTNGALVITHLRKEDAGNYICVATSVGLPNLEAVTIIEIQRRGECMPLLLLLLLLLHFFVILAVIYTGEGGAGGLGGIIELHVKENFPDCKRNFFRNDVHLLPLLRNLIHILY